jgi:protein phosphatase
VTDDAAKLVVPELSLVVLIGASGAGKSSFARRHFRPTEVLSADFFRGLVSDDESDQSASAPAFEALHFVAAKRLAAGRLTVIDATNVQRESRAALVALARRHHCVPVAIVLNLPKEVCQERNRARPDRDFRPHVIPHQISQLRRSLGALRREGFRYVYVLHAVEEVERVRIERQALWTDKRSEHGPFDVIGDVHGCLAELRELLEALGYAVHETLDASGERCFRVEPPPGRRAVFLGDLVDRGPDTPGVLRLVMSMLEGGSALCVAGNHDVKLARKLAGRDVRITHGLAESLAQLEREPAAFVARVREFLDGLIGHYVLDVGRLVVAHAGMKAEMQGRASAAAREFSLYGETTGETDEFGLPVRADWAASYRGRAQVVYGHTPVAEPEWLNGTINIDTGCVFGGRLTALRYPERELVSVPAQRTWYEPARPFLPDEARAPALSAQQRHDDLLDLADVMGKRQVQTRLHHGVTVREENAAAALEVMSRFALDPRWLVYLPPTMSPCETVRSGPLLEHPSEAFDHYRSQGTARVVCEEKHMGSRAVVVVCRDEAAARSRFGVEGAGLGAVFTRTGRSFFGDAQLERALLGRVRDAFAASGLFVELASDWAVLDCELLPWSAKAQELLREQYAAVGAAARSAVPAALAALEAAAARGLEVGAWLASWRERDADTAAYVEAYRRYCWPVSGLGDLRLAPFHLLASEKAVHVDRDHVWHMEQLARLAASAPELLVATPHRTIDVTDAASRAEGIRWWEELTERGGEGMVVKPHAFVARGRRGLVQPALKVRGREYLRIIYGPEYTAPENLERLRSRALAGKRSLALREFALGVEALERFVRREPLRRVHECVFGVLALESEPVDPRL